ncbi:Sec-independent protein translocase subunit TatA [Nakamurella sp.]|uniref:Sec-independent protein translocase subunit TatA n=1 Tax=Nakamurella sp. TaxID=1869182 RepID=UPI003B3AF081
MGGLSWWHWLIIIAVFVLLFGAKKLPDTARGLGRSLRILKSEVSAMHEDSAATMPTASTAPVEPTVGQPVATPVAGTSPTIRVAG